MATVAELLDLALSKDGYEYDTISPYRWTGERHFFDCSGFQFYLPHTLGVAPEWWWPPGSHDQALAMRNHGLLIEPVDNHDGWGMVGNPAAARDIPGALVTKGPHHSYVGGSGIPGHIAMSLGNGHTIEAMGHAWGVCVGNFDGRGWNNAGYMPGIDYANAEPPTTHPAPTPLPNLEALVFTFIPRNAKIAAGVLPTFALDPQTGIVTGYNRARLRWRMPPNTNPPASTGVTPTQRAYPAPSKGPFIGMQELDAHPGLGVITAAGGKPLYFDIVLP